MRLILLELYRYFFFVTNVSFVAPVGSLPV